MEIKYILTKPCKINLSFVLNQLLLTGVDQADYFLTNYRWHPQEYFLHQEVFTVNVDNQKILSVFKLR